MGFFILLPCETVILPRIMKASFNLSTFYLYFSLIFLLPIPLFAQVGINTTDPKAMLDIESEDSGILIPRVALTSTLIATPVVSPELSELVYNTQTAGTAPNDVSPGFYYWNGSKWIRLSAGGGPSSDDKWDLSGNSATVPGTNFLGTTDAKDLYFKTNGSTRLIIPSDKNQIYANTRGTKTAPFYSFKDDPDTGIYSPTANAVDIATDGITRFRVGNEVHGQDYIRSFINHRFADGVEDKPSITFQEQPNMGLWKVGSHILGFSANSKERMRVSDDGVNINGALLVREGPRFLLSSGVNTVDILNSPSLPNPAEPFSQYRIEGPTAPFSIRGITTLSTVGSGYLADRNNGYRITLINTTPHPLTVLHNDPSEQTDQRIYCPGESNLILTGKYATVTLQYNKTLKKWVIVDYAGDTAGSPGGSDIPYGTNIQSVKGTSDILTNSNTFADMQNMSITFVPKHPVVYVSFSASGDMDVFNGMPEQSFANFRLVNVTAGNRVEAGITTLVTDYDSDNYLTWEAAATSWNASLNMLAVQVTPGISNTLKVQWLRDGNFPSTLFCNVLSDPNQSHRTMTIFD